MRAKEFSILRIALGTGTGRYNPKRLQNTSTYTNQGIALSCTTPLATLLTVLTAHNPLGMHLQDILHRMRTGVEAMDTNKYPLYTPHPLKIMSPCLPGTLTKLTSLLHSTRQH